MPLHLSHGLQRPSVEVLNRNAFQVDSFEAANIDCRHPIAIGIGTFSVGVNAAGLAKAVFDDVLKKDGFVIPKPVRPRSWRNFHVSRIPETSK